MYGLSALTDVAVGRRWTAVVVDVFVLMILLVDVKGNLHSYQKITLNRSI